MQITHLLTAILLFFFTPNLSAQREWKNAEFNNLHLGYPLDGFLTLDNEEHNYYILYMIAQPDGKTIIFGRSQNQLTPDKNYVLARFGINGALDNSFGKEGMVTLPNEYHDHSYSFGDADMFILQSDGKIVIIGGTGEQVST